MGSKFMVALEDLDISPPSATQKYNPNQPRHPKGHPEGGRWISEGGYRSGEREPGELVEVHPSVREYLSDEDIAELQRLIEDKDSTATEIIERLEPLDAAAKSIEPTIPDGMEPGEKFWSERKYVDGMGTEQALEALDAKAASYAGEAGVKQNREAIILIGPPAAGKSSSAEAIAARAGFAIVDGDDAKKLIPEYAGGVGASAVHEESSLLSGFSRARHISRGDNVILPVVGGSPASVESKIDLFRRNGYKTQVVLVDVHPDVAARRMAGRTLRTGRHIASSYAISIGNRPRETFNVLRDNYPALGFARIDANGPKGSEYYAEAQGIPAVRPGQAVF